MSDARDPHGRSGGAEDRRHLTCEERISPAEAFAVVDTARRAEEVEA